MRRTIVAVLSAVVLMLGSAGPAGSASVTVPGSGDIDHLFINNASSAVVVKMYAPGGATAVASVEVWLKGTDGVKYHAFRWHEAGGFHQHLYRGNTEIQCADFSISWNGTGQFWRFFVPRSCLNRLTNRIKVKAYHFAAGAAGPSVVDWTANWIRRG